MDWLEGAAKLLGFGAPFMYGGATYSAFHVLDGAASDEAKEAISDLLSVRRYDRAKVSAALVEVFDRIYGTPLFSWKAFRRSALFTVLISLIFLYEMRHIGELYKHPENLFSDFSEPDFVRPERAQVIASTLFNVFSDYLTLFAVRAWLGNSKSRPFLALGVGFVISVAATFCLAFARAWMAGWVAIGSGGIVSLWPTNFEMLLGLLFEPILLTIPAVAVFAWLPLFAISMLLLQLMEPFAWAVSKMQWFLQEGKKHPFEAIGVVAGVIVFGLAAVWQVFFKGTAI